MSPASSPSIKRGWGGFALGLALWWLPWVAGGEEAPDGGRLFYGQTALIGQLYVHNRPLGAEYVRCANCHRLQDQPSAEGRFGPDLGARFLTEPSARRGGPERAYTEQSFCEMLRSGKDPTAILIGTDMPRYRLSAAACRALWLFLQEH
ncbi:hypothetical protein HNO92_001575 [Chromobacterium alkanivorans]|uniref:hypothetical protein n=1 Tax=Chromobacterium TaxID=535 RepID=UPI00069F92DB|nr:MULTISPECIES: hypothetical protein [Chromobacterium]MBN3005277.1 hypothetical protein [Chromobacterium alkanivorans]MCS3804525.1 hypothetical protein [Chromobacterium alkanivorans]MCS3818864.1 hypothetical protein [Chromobacterium alkanivorans]MCS3873278.1 hypothetical protein [Chromobacterium alkanivorans]